MESRPASRGDVFLVPARTVHAIGAGCLILEVQEPTDFTIQPEHFCDEYELNEQEMYIGLSRESAVDCFDFSRAPDTRLAPKTVAEGNGVRVESLISAADTECFIINRILLSGGEYRPCVSDSYAVYIVTEGEGEIVGDGYRIPLKKGDYFFMPACLMGKCDMRGRLSVVECY